MSDKILGVDSAYDAAKEAGLNNMMISAPLVVELIDRIAKLEEENAFFMDFAKAFYKHFGGDI